MSEECDFFEKTLAFYLNHTETAKDERMLDNYTLLKSELDVGVGDGRFTFVSGDWSEGVFSFNVLRISSTARYKIVTTAMVRYCGASGIFIASAGLVTNKKRQMLRLGKPIADKVHFVRTESSISCFFRILMAIGRMKMG